MISDSLVELSRLQFAVTALYHFLFVPLTLGLSFLLAIMESVYVMTGKEVYKEMVKFWGKLFGINFALGVTTGLTMEFQFGTNWAYYSHYVGDIFGIPLAIEGLMAFFLESTFIGLFFFGWERLTKRQHLLVTWLVAIGSNLSALWILIANGWMQNPIGSKFNYETMRMELTNFSDLIFNPVAQVKFVHTVSAGYVTGSIFVLAVSSYFLLRKRHIAFSQRSFAIAAAFGFASVCSVIILGDESGYEIGDVQKNKLAVIEAEWETQPPPADFTLFGIPDDEKMETKYRVKIPWLLGLIATRSIDEKVIGIKDIIKNNEVRIRKGIKAYTALAKLKINSENKSALKNFKLYESDLGYGLLLKRYISNPGLATEKQIKKAARESLPKVWPIFWSFRIMVACGFTMFALFLLAFYHSTKGNFDKTWLLKFAVFSLPLPWIAAELGWVVAEYGRQPWAISGILPTHLGVSSVPIEKVWGSLSAFIIFYSFLMVIELYLMIKYIKKGPLDHSENIPGTIKE